MTVGGVGNGAAEEDWRWDLNPGTAAIPGEDHIALAEKGEDHIALAEKGEDHTALGCSLLPRGLGSKRDFAWKKRGERTLAGGPREGATWLWINWRLLQQHS